MVKRNEPTILAFLSLAISSFLFLTFSEERFFFEWVAQLAQGGQAWDISCATEMSLNEWGLQGKFEKHQSQPYLNHF
jgi:hypothetical protein